MKHNKLPLCLLTAALLSAAVSFSGCDQVKNAADNARSTVTSLADKLTNFEMDQEADALNTAIQNFRNGILNGDINSITKGNTVTANLPSPDDDLGTRTAALSELTIRSVLEEQGMLARYPEDRISDFVSSNGKIKYKGSLNPLEESGLPLSYNTTIAAAAQAS